MLYDACLCVGKVADEVRTARQRNTDYTGWNLSIGVGKVTDQARTARQRNTGSAGCSLSTCRQSYRWGKNS